MNTNQHYQQLIQPRETVMRFVVSIAKPPPAYMTKTMLRYLEQGRDLNGRPLKPKVEKNPELAGLPPKERKKILDARRYQAQKAAKQ